MDAGRRCVLLCLSVSQSVSQSFSFPLALVSLRLSQSLCGLGLFSSSGFFPTRHLPWALPSIGWPYIFPFFSLATEKLAKYCMDRPQLFPIGTPASMTDHASSHWFLP